MFVLGLTGNAPSPDNCEHLVDERRYPVHGAATNLISRACACFMQVLMVFAAFSLSAPFCSSATGVVWIVFSCGCNGVPICAPSSRPALTKCAELKKQHPELVVGGFTLAVALPSALGEYPELKFLVASELVLQAQIVF